MDEKMVIFGLMKAAEDQQGHVKQAIAGLVNERAAMAQERQQLNVATQQVKDLASSLPSDLKAAAIQAVNQAVADVMANTSKDAVTAVEKASQPLIQQVSGVAKTVGASESRLRKASTWLSWQFGAVVMAGVVTVFALSWIAIGWQRHVIDGLVEQRLALTDEVAQLQTTVDKLAQKGGRLKISTCGGRLCIEASTNQGEGFTNWRNTNWYTLDGNKIPLVIPRGY